MPRKIPDRNDLFFRRLSNPGLHAAGGVPGLHMRVSTSGGKSWILRLTIGARRVDMGLGGYPGVLASEARTAAREARALLAKGINPVEARDQARVSLGAKPRKRGEPVAGLVTIQSATEAYHAIKRSEWSDKHRANWFASMEQHVFPVIGPTSVADATIEDMLKVLKPIWLTKTKTATHVRARIEAVLGWAITSGHRTAPNPATWGNQLENLLPKPGKVSKVEHFKALPYEQAPALYQALVEDIRPASQALRLVMLTAARSNEVRGLDWSELDLKAGIWTLPPARAKSRRTHRVPLVPAAVALLEGLPGEREGLVFAGPVSGRSLEDTALGNPMRQLGYGREIASVHGLRATFRSWVAEQHRADEAIAEAQLQHQTRSATERAYLRTDLLAERRALMTIWATYLTTPVNAWALPASGEAAS